MLATWTASSLTVFFEATPHYTSLNPTTLSANVDFLLEETLRTNREKSLHSAAITDTAGQLIIVLPSRCGVGKQALDNGLLMGSALPVACTYMLRLHLRCEKKIAHGKVV